MDCVRLGEKDTDYTKDVASAVTKRDILWYIGVKIILITTGTILKTQKTFILKNIYIIMASLLNKCFKNWDILGKHDAKFLNFWLSKLHVTLYTKVWGKVDIVNIPLREKSQIFAFHPKSD